MKIYYHNSSDIHDFDYYHGSGLLNISIHNTNGFIMNYHSFRLHFILFQEILLVNLHIFHTNSYEITIQMVRQSTITIVYIPRLSRLS